MANEYLKRTHTSSGNYKVATFSLWMKGQEIGSTQQKPIYFYDGATLFQVLFERSTGTHPGSLIVYSSSTDLRFGGLYRDVSSWMNLVISVDTTKSEADRISVYLNGSKLDLVGSQSSNTPNYPAANAELLSSVQTINALTGQGSYQVFDYFYVDGQALTADVFGFYKDGDGYISVGSTQATDFKPGQWMPHSPRKIKSDIQRRGGFGVNGFYLPMNDSSNFGADFHCEPNSIITLKGEDLPQPRNGAPTTSDAYVSELRTDPYAANLVLAVPGISTATGSNLVTNGTFDTNTTGWTSQDATLSVDNGRIKVLTTNTNYGSALQTVTGLTVGQRYTFQVDMYYGNASLVTAISGASPSINSGWQSADYVWRTSFTATTTSLVIDFQMASQSNVYGFWDNVILKAEDAPKDYSADIKGSGTNKTLTPANQAGVGYEIPSYYGSAMTFDGTGDYLETTLSAFGTNDFTIEYWINPNSISASYTGTVRLQASTGVKRIEQAFQSSTLQIYTDTGAWRDTGFAPPINQWTHIALEKYNGYLTVYANGVTVWTVTNTRDYDESFDVDIANHVNQFNGYMQDVRVYSGVAKYKGGFDVSKPYTPVGFEGESWRQVPDNCKNNFATLSPLSYQTTGTYGSSVPVLSNGNLTYTHGQTSQWERSNSTMGVGEGKWYFEFEVVTRPVTGNSENWAVGVRESDSSLFYGETDGFEDLGDHVYWIDAGTAKIVSNQDRSAGSTSGITAVANGDIINIAFEKTATALKVWFGKNGTYFNSGNPATGSNPAVNHSTTSTFIIPAVAYYQYSGQEEPVATFNFGQNPTFSGTKTAGTNADSNGKGLFKYQPPAGYLALCEDNLPTPAISDPGKHFKTVLYTGDGNGGRSITGVGFAPDLVWTKRRSAAASPFLFDSVRGAGKFLQSHSTAAEGNDPINTLMSFDIDGFTSGNTNGMNQSTHNYVAWCWKAGGAAVSNSDGTITSQVSANQTAGFSIVKWTSNGNTSVTSMGHGLGKTPKFMIHKRLGVADNWFVYHESIQTNDRQYLRINTNDSIITSPNDFWSTSSSTMGIRQSSIAANGQDCIAYCWAEIEGYSKFGSYVGNASADGTFIYCGFKPAFVITKRTDGTSSWLIHDSSRDPVNPVLGALYTNSSDAEGRGSVRVDFLSNGFKHRNADGGAANNYSNNYIFIAFAESPFQTANAK